MVERAGYGQFCPVSMAAEILCSRWTILVIRELLAGSTRFNDLRRGLPRMSPALLSKRLRDLERAGIITATPNAKGIVEYRLSPAGEDLEPVVMGMGFWGQRWVESSLSLSLRNLDPSLLMWDIRRHLRPEPLPPRRTTIHFLYPELAEGECEWWLVIEDGTVDLCNFDPGYEVDLVITTSLRTMTAVWMGISSLQKEIDARRLELDGDRQIIASMKQWLCLSPFAVGDRRVA